VLREVSGISSSCIFRLRMYITFRKVSYYTQWKDNSNCCNTWNGVNIVHVKANRITLSLSTIDSKMLPTKYTQRIKAKPYHQEFFHPMKYEKRQILCHIYAIKVFLLFFFSKFLSQIFASHVYRVFGLTRILSPSTPIPPPSLSLASCCGSDQSILRPASPQSSSIPLFLERITTVTITIINESSTHYSARKLLIKNMASKKTYCICQDFIFL